MDNVFHLTRQQARIWRLHQDNHAAAGTRMAVEIRGSLDEARLEESLEELMARHEILFTGIGRKPGLKNPRQFLAEGPQYRLERHDCSALSHNAVCNEVDRLLAARDTSHKESGVDCTPLLVKQSGDRAWLLLGLPGLNADAATLVNFIRELTALYDGRELNPEPLQYADYEAWQAELDEEDDEDAEAARAFWKEHAQTLSPSPPRNGAFTPRATTPLDLDIEGLTVMTDRYGLDPMDVFLAAFSVVVRRLGHTPPHLGLVSEGRKFEGMDEAFGPYASVLPLIEQPSPGLPFREVARLLGTARQKAEEFEEYFTPQLVGLDPEQGFDLIFHLVAGPGTPRVGPLSFNLTRLESHEEPYLLKLMVLAEEDRFSCRLFYNEARCSNKEATRFATRWCTLLAAGVNHPETAVDALPIIGSEEFKFLIDDFNNVGVTQGANELVFQRFTQHAARQPNHPALLDGQTVLSYARADALSNILAHRLIRAGVRQAPVVAIAMDRCIPFVIGILAAMKAGAAYLPVDPTQPTARQAGILKDAGARLVLAGESWEIDGCQALTVDLSETGDNPGAPDVAVTAKDLAYVLYTSGSTGKPKGVMLEHAQLGNYTTAAIQRLGFTSDMSFAVVSTMHADLGNTCLFPALWLGATLHVILHEVATDPARFAAYFHTAGIDVLKIVPSHLKALLAHSNPGEILPRRILVLGGEASSSSLIDAVRKASPTTKIFNHYGPTEATVGAMALEIDAQYSHDKDPLVPLGQPLSGYRVYILNDYDSPSPIGVPGEICIAGAGLARGYLNRPDKTAARFVAPSAGTVGGISEDRIYKTGDLAQFRADGTIEFLGRRDHQVKIRGFRIELDEINEAILGFEGITDALVISREEANGSKRLVGYFVAQTAIQVEALQLHLETLLPDYMAPSVMMQLSAIPLTPNGKIDRNALPEPNQGICASFIEPSTPTEQTLADIFQDVLGLPKISIEDNFFRIGGDSIQSILIVARAGQRGIHFTIQDIFIHQSVAKLAANARLSGEAARPEDVARPSVVRTADQLTPEDFPLADLDTTQLANLLESHADIEDIYPLSPIQSGMLFHALYDKESRAYLEQKVVNLVGRVNLEVFEKAWISVVEQHPALRTAFAWDVSSAPVQFYERNIRPKLIYRDWRQVPKAEIPTRFDAFLAEDRGRGFPLDQAPLMRLNIFHLENERFRFLWSHHHILFDGWSLPKIFREFLASYAAIAEGQDPHYEYAVPFRNYISWLANQDLSVSKSLWREELAGFTKPLDLRLAAGAATGALDTSDVYSYESLQIEESDAQVVSNWAREHRLTVNTLLQVSWAVVLADLVKIDDVVFGATVSGRPAQLQGVSGMIGMFLNSLPVRVRIDPDQDLKAWMHAHQDRQIKLREFEYTPLVQIQKWSEVPGGTALFDSLFIFENVPEAKSSMQRQATLDFTVEMVDFHALEKTNYPMIFKILPHGGLNLEIMYDRGLLTTATIKRMLGRFAFVLRDLTNAKTHRLGDLFTALSEEKARESAVRKRLKAAGFKKYKVKK